MFHLVRVAVVECSLLCFSYLSTGDACGLCIKFNLFIITHKSELSDHFAGLNYNHTLGIYLLCAIMCYVLLMLFSVAQVCLYDPVGTFFSASNFLDFYMKQRIYGFQILEVLFHQFEAPWLALVEI